MQRLQRAFRKAELSRAAQEQDDDTIDDEGGNADAGEPRFFASLLLRAARGGRAPVVAQLVSFGRPDCESNNVS